MIRIVLCTSVRSALLSTSAALAMALAVPALGGGDPACPGEGSCSEPNGSPGCDNEECCNLVCDQDPFCCETEWDASCVATADGECSDIGCTLDTGGAADETEDCGLDVNGGCNSAPPAFGSIDAGQTMSGSLFADGGARDLDWFELVVDDPNGDGKAVITAEISSQFFGQVSIVDASDCGAVAFVGTANGTNNCQPTTIERCVDAPGTYVILVGIIDEAGGALFEGVPCGLGINDYVVNVSVNDDAADCVLATCENPGDTTLSQTSSQEIVAFTGIACTPNMGMTTSDNKFARTYDLSNLLPGEALTLTCVEVGIETYTGGVEDLIATLNIYEDTNGGAPSAPGDDLALLGTTDVLIPLGTTAELLVGVFDPPLNIPADIVVVAELDVPDLSGIGGIFPGANTAGESGPVYLRSDACGVTTYTTYGDLGVPTAVHWVQNILGDVGGGEPCLPDLDGSGEVGPGDLAILLGGWGGGGPADLDGSGEVGPGDLAILLGGWGPCP